MPAMLEPLEKHLEERGFSLYKASLKAGLDPNNVRSAARGDRNFSDLMMQSLASVPELGLTLEQLRAWKVTDEYPELFDGGPIAITKRLMVKGTVTGGVLALSDPCHEEAIPLGHTWPYGDDVFGLRVKGDSMAPTVPDGSVVFVREVFDPPYEKGLYVVETKDYHATLKRIEKKGTTWRLVPDNGDHEAVEIKLADVHRLFKVLGYHKSFEGV